MGQEIVCFVTLFILSGCSLGLDSQPLDRRKGEWILSVENLHHKHISSLKIRFTLQGSDSCMAGDWRLVKVMGYQYIDKLFFPLSNPLSYELRDNIIVIGRNGLCDSYLQLGGKLSESGASGKYYSVSLYGKRHLGFFTLTHVD